MKIENFIKGPMTTLLGFLLMCTAALAWFTKIDLINEITDIQAGGCFGLGVALVFMKDELPGFIRRWVGNKMPNEKNNP